MRVEKQELKDMRDLAKRSSALGKTAYEELLTKYEKTPDALKIIKNEYAFIEACTSLLEASTSLPKAGSSLSEADKAKTADHIYAKLIKDYPTEKAYLDQLYEAQKTFIATALNSLREEKDEARVKSNYKKLALKNHPDREDGKEAWFKLIQQEYAEANIRLSRKEESIALEDYYVNAVTALSDGIKFRFASQQRLTEFLEKLQELLPDQVQNSIIADEEKGTLILEYDALADFFKLLSHNPTYKGSDFIDLFENGDIHAASKALDKMLSEHYLGGAQTVFSALNFAYAEAKLQRKLEKLEDQKSSSASRSEKRELAEKIEVLATQLRCLAVIMKTAAKREKSWNKLALLAEENLNQWHMEAEKQGSPAPSVRIIEKDCLEAAAALSRATGKPAVVLNMANSVFPGGGFIYGKGAQEEDIFRRSNLHTSIKRNQVTPHEGGGVAGYPWKYNDQMSRLIDGKDGQVLYEDNQDYICYRASADDDYAPLEGDQVFYFKEIRAAAPDCRIDKKTHQRTCDPRSSNYASLLERKIGAVLNTLSENRCENVVLSAWGCGAFENPPEVVAEKFATMLAAKIAACRKDNDSLSFQTVVFAINEPEHLKIFKDVFSRHAKKYAALNIDINFNVPAAKPAPNKQKSPDEAMRDTPMDAYSSYPDLVRDVLTRSRAGKLFRQNIRTSDELKASTLENLQSGLDELPAAARRKAAKEYKPLYSEGNYSAANTQVKVLNADTLAVAATLAKRQKTAVLNMATRDYSGGGATLGATAQEEHIMASTNALHSLLQYQFKKRSDNALLTQNGRVSYPEGSFNPTDVLYSKDILVSKEKIEEVFFPRDTPFSINLITSAGVDLRKGRASYEELPEQSNVAFAQSYRERLTQIIYNQIYTALEDGNTAIVPGALGCGVFENDPRIVAEVYREVLSLPEFIGKLTIHCAVMSRNDNNFAVFNKEFQKPLTALTLEKTNELYQMVDVQTLNAKQYQRVYAQALANQANNAHSQPDLLSLLSKLQSAKLSDDQRKVSLFFPTSSTQDAFKKYLTQHFPMVREDRYGSFYLNRREVDLLIGELHNRGCNAKNHPFLPMLVQAQRDLIQAQQRRVDEEAARFEQEQRRQAEQWRQAEEQNRQARRDNKPQANIMFLFAPLISVSLAGLGDAKTINLRFNQLHDAKQFMDSFPDLNAEIKGNRPGSVFLTLQQGQHLIRKLENLRLDGEDFYGMIKSATIELGKSQQRWNPNSFFAEGPDQGQAKPSFNHGPRGPR